MIMNISKPIPKLSKRYNADGMFLPGVLDNIACPGLQE